MQVLKSGVCDQQQGLRGYNSSCSYAPRVISSSKHALRCVTPFTAERRWQGLSRARTSAREHRSVRRRIWPFDQAWDTSLVQGVDTQTIASNLFASSIFPYAGFLYHLQKSKKAPGLMLFGFYFLLVFVAATIPAGIYAKIHYNTILANVDWLHGTAESFLTITNLLIVLGLRQGIQQAELRKQEALLKDVPEVDSVQREAAEMRERQ